MQIFTANIKNSEIVKLSVFRTHLLNIIVNPHFSCFKKNGRFSVFLGRFFWKHRGKTPKEGSPGRFHPPPKSHALAIRIAWSWGPQQPWRSSGLSFQPLEESNLPALKEVMASKSCCFAQNKRSLISSFQTFFVEPLLFANMFICFCLILVVLHQRALGIVASLSMRVWHSYHQRRWQALSQKQGVRTSHKVIHSVMELNPAPAGI